MSEFQIGKVYEFVYEKELKNDDDILMVDEDVNTFWPNASLCVLFTRFKVISNEKITTYWYYDPITILSGNIAKQFLKKAKKFKTKEVEEFFQITAEQISADAEEYIQKFIADNNKTREWLEARIKEEIEDAHGLLNEEGAKVVLHSKLQRYKLEINRR